MVDKAPAAEDLKDTTAVADTGDKTPAATDKAPASPDKSADRVKDATVKAKAPAPEADEEEDIGDDVTAEGKDEGDEAAEGDAPRSSKNHLEDDDDTEDGAAETDGKKAAKPAAAPWRDTALKTAGERLTKRAKTDADKKGIPGQLERIKAQLARYATPELALIAGMEAQEKLRAGQAKQKPAADAPPEEWAAYREAMNLPTAAKEIDIPKVAGHQWTERDKPFIDSFKETAFEAEIPQAAVNKMTEWYIRAGENAHKLQMDALAAIDKADKKEAKELLQDEFGDEFKQRLAAMDQLLKDDEVFPEGTGAMIWDARTPEGKKLVHNAAFVKFVTEVAVDRYGDGMFITGDAKSAVSTRKAELQKLMRENREEYYRTGGDKEMLQIVAAEEKSAGGGRRSRAA